MANAENNFNENDFKIISPDGNSSSSSFANTNTRDYSKVTLFNSSGNIQLLENGTEAIFYSLVTDNPNIDNILLQDSGKVNNITDIILPPNDFTIYTNPHNQNIFIKPNEILSSSQVPQGNYKLQVDFLNQLRADFVSNKDRFVIKQISPSRTEVRIKLYETQLDNSPNSPSSAFLEGFKQHMGEPYQYNHVLHIGKGRNIPIVNYIVDKFSDGENNQSIILKLYEALPSDINNLQFVTIEKEILVTQTEDIYYFSDVQATTTAGGLEIDTQNDWINETVDDDDNNFQNYSELSGSISTQVLNGIFTGSSYDYPNLNTDFSKFENHTFFGSAKRKLENFQNKIKDIQGYYSLISQSLSPQSGSALEGDSESLVNYRLDLFDKAQKKIDNFTPYERFLYFDAQSDSTASKLC